MKTLLGVILLFTSAISTFGQTIRVVDTQNKPVENAIAIGDDFTSNTNSDGYLNFFPKDGTSTISIIHPNYKRKILTWDQLVQLNFEIVLKEKMRQLQEITIHPSKRSQSLSEVPRKVIALSPENTQLYQPQTTADLLGNSGEVYIQKSQMGGGSPMIRGFSANRILMVVDGIRLNNAIYRSGNLHNVISLDASTLEQTEIIIGPGSVIYGSDALGGVLHFYTFNPKLSTTKIKTPVNVMLRYSSANFEKTAHVDFNLSSKKWASVSSITFSDFDDLTMGNHQHDDYTRKHYVTTQNGIDQFQVNPNPNKQIASAYGQLNMLQKIRFRPSEIVDFEYAFHFSKTSDIPRYDRLIQYSGDTLKYAEWYYGPQQWMMHSLKCELSTKNDLFDRLTFQTAFQDYTESRNSRKFGESERSERTENVDIYSLNIDADKYFSKSQSLFYGIEGIFNKVHSTGLETNILNDSTAEIASRYPDGSQWWSMAAYVMYNQTLNAKTVLEAGARYNFSGMKGTFDKQFYDFPFDDFNNSDGAANVNFGMVFTPSDRLHINFNAASGFRAPNIDDAAKVFDSEPGCVVVPNPDLEPEYASSFEAGLKWNKNENFVIDISLFYTRLFNAMVRRDGQLDGQDSIIYDGEMSKVMMLTNTSQANIGGVSTRIYYSPINHLLLNSGINWQTGKDSDNLPMRHVAPLFADFHVKFEQEKYQADVYAIYNGEISYENLADTEREKPYMYASNQDGNPYSPRWWTLNIKGNYQLNELVRLSAGIENLLNVRYRPYSSGIVASGLNVIFSVNISL
jgi:hemoglobin/transferrin/lactoferrin receptor protein